MSGGPDAGGSVDENGTDGSVDENGTDDESGPPVVRVPVPVDTRAPDGRTNAYLVGGLLVDPAARTNRLDAAVANHGVNAVAVTHTHPDHVGAVADYARETGATVYAHADHVDRFRSAVGVAPDATFRDGDRLVAARRDRPRVTAVDTPGHAADHVAFAVAAAAPNATDGGAAVLPRTSLLVGDLAVAEGSVAVAGADADIRAYLRSLERVRDGGFDRLYPGHGAIIEEPESVCQRLIDHRLDRERAVLAAVENGATDVEAIVESVYKTELTGVADLARATVLAHLEALVADGRIDEWPMADRLRSTGDREDDDQPTDE